jgi:hypothetical protein
MKIIFQLAQGMLAGAVMVCPALLVALHQARAFK